MAEQLKIGDTIYVYDVNRRYYDGERHLIARECWRPMKIVGQTRVSWITDYDRLKFPKKNDGRYLTSEQEIDEWEWVRNNVYKISSLLDLCRDYGTVKSIAEILDYKEKKNA